MTKNLLHEDLIQYTIGFLSLSRICKHAEFFLALFRSVKYGKLFVQQGLFLLNVNDHHSYLITISLIVK